jgi:LPPG:FO 2-phospho-L-lactate transferase
LGDHDLATHLYRTERRAAGAPLSQVTAEIAAAWGLGLRVLPVTDDPLRTILRIDGPDPSGAASPRPGHATGDREAGDLGSARGPNTEGGLAAGREVSFQEYFVQLQHSVPVRAVRFDGDTTAGPAPGVLEAVATADTIVIAPSNPLISIAPVLAVPGVREAVIARRDRVVAISPIVDGKALKGPADRLLPELGHEPSVVGVAQLYAPVASTLVIDEADAARAEEVRHKGLRCVVTDTIMRDPVAAAKLSESALAALGGGEK